MAQIRSSRRSSAIRGNVGVMQFPRIAASHTGEQPSFGWLLLAVAVVASAALVRAGVASRFEAASATSQVPAGTILALEGQANPNAQSVALQVSQPSIQAERLQGSSADSYFQPTGGSDLQVGGTSDSVQTTGSSYSLQGSVGTSRR